MRCQVHVPILTYRVEVRAMDEKFLQKIMGPLGSEIWLGGEVVAARLGDIFTAAAG